LRGYDFWYYSARKAMKNHLLRFTAFLMLTGMILFELKPVSSSHAQTSGYFHTQGGEILDSAGNPVIFTGINWFGLETESYAPHGLWARSLDSLLDQIVQLGFNVIRLPYSNQLFDPGSVPNGINYELNPDLKGLNGLQIMDKLIADAGKRGLKVILDRHRPDSHAQSELWYTSQYSQERWIQDWVMLAKRYAGNDTVIGADLHNEPHGKATWGTGDPATDWRLAAEKAGNAILAVNPNWLIIVQGVDHIGDDWYWWGGNLSGARQYPVQLDVPGRLVYSTHVYGPGVYPQPWFSDPNFPNNLPGIWESHWSYLQKEGIAPVVVGEFGGHSVGNDKEGVWQRSLVSYLSQNRISYFYWTLNPDSGDTGGVLLNDWQSVDPGKKALLSGYQFPLLGIEQRGAQPATQLPPPAPPTQTPVQQSTPSGQPPDATPITSPAPPPDTPSPNPGVPAVQTAASPVAVTVKYHSDNPVALASETKADFIIANSGSQPLPLSQVELFYWISPQNAAQPFEFHCDWAAVGCENLVGDFHSSGSGIAYLRLNFSPSSPTLSAGADSGEIKIRFNHPDWSEFRQDQDYSFSPTTSYVDWPQVALAVAGKLVWGQPPGQTPAASSTQLATTATLSPANLTPTAAPSSMAILGATSSSTQTGYPAAQAQAQLPAVQNGAGASASGLQIMPSVALGSALAVLAIWILYRFFRRLKPKRLDD
jgi:endoglucanase